MDETRSQAQPPVAPIPQPPPPDDAAGTLDTRHVRPAEPKRTRDTGAVSTHIRPDDLPTIPGYQVLEMIGHGGMAVVYKARQIRANRLIALKMILTGKHANLTERIRFQIEAEAIAGFQHPNIVPLYEVGEYEGQPFFSLEFCAGGAVDKKLKDKRLSMREAAELMEKLARAIQYAHIRGVVHRDLKPGNVLLTAAGDPKITDFGLAKRMDAGGDLSQTGHIMGTAAYMAPEQAAGQIRTIGPATDVYGLGAILYELLTGRPPFQGDTLDLLLKVRTEEPPLPSRLNPKVPRDLVPPQASKLGLLVFW